MYTYSKDVVWKNIEFARERLGYSKKELADKLGLTASTYSDCIARPIDMRISYAMEILAGVGLTLDEALQENSEIRYFSFLDAQGIIFSNLPADCLLKYYDLKALIPTFYDAVDYCRDRRIVTIIQRCLIMSGRDLYHFFRTTMGGQNYIEPISTWLKQLSLEWSDLSYDSLRRLDNDKHDIHRWHHFCCPNVVEQFWQNGIRHEFGQNVGFSHLDEMQKEKKKDHEAALFAERLGLSVGQMTKYLRKSRGEQEKANSEPRLSRAAAIANALEKDLDYLVEPIYSLKKWTNCDIDTPSTFETDPFARWYNRFFINFRDISRSFVLLQALIERYRVFRDEERDWMTSLAQEISRF